MNRRMLLITSCDGDSRHHHRRDAAGTNAGAGAQHADSPRNEKRASSCSSTARRSISGAASRWRRCRPIGVRLTARSR
jgi:hypothetical protein